jgi:ATP-binding cassette subfamily F protein uup
VLLLDEPTNDLDIDTLTGLEDLLDGWPGTLVVASHDRYFVERVCDSVVAIVDGALAALPGGVEEYLRRRAAAAGPGAGAAAGGGAGPVGATRPGQPSPSAVPGTATPGAQARATRKELSRLERRIAALEARETELHTALAAHATDYARVTELDAELRAVATEREAAETTWLQLSE